MSLPTGPWAIVVADVAREHAESRKRGHSHEPRALGAVHAVCDARCPEGRLDCEDCGDPAHAGACLAAGHCPDCVALRHGMAPDAVLERHGYVAVKA